MEASNVVMMKSIDVKLNERVVVLRGGLPLRALGPGRHTVWGFSITDLRWTTDSLVFQAHPAVRAVLDGAYGEVTLASHERVILFHD